MTISDIGEFIRESRKSQGLTGVDLGRSIGVGRSTISDLERNKKAVNERTLGQIAAVLGWSINELRQMARSSELDEEKACSVYDGYFFATTDFDDAVRFELIESQLKEADLLQIQGDVVTSNALMQQCLNDLSDTIRLLRNAQGAKKHLLMNARRLKVRALELIHWNKTLFVPKDALVADQSDYLALIALGQENNISEWGARAHYFRTNVYYIAKKFDKAQKHFDLALKENRAFASDPLGLRLQLIIAAYRGDKSTFSVAEKLALEMIEKGIINNEAYVILLLEALGRGRNNLSLPNSFTPLDEAMILTDNQLFQRRYTPIHKLQVNRAILECLFSEKRPKLDYAYTLIKDALEIAIIFNYERHIGQIKDYAKKLPPSPQRKELLYRSSSQT